MRLNRFLARAGVASRRGAEAVIASGRVTVNGETVTHPAFIVDPQSDIVEIVGERVALPDDFVYVAFHKPAGCVVTMNDPQGRRTVGDIVGDLGPGVVPVGRLDAPTEGLLLLTNDGTLAHRVAHPSFELDKVYEVWARGVLTEADRQQLERGVELDGRTTSPAVVEVLSTERDLTLATITIHEGRKRQVRRMFEAVGHPVRRLIRTRVGPLELGDLRPGRFRRLDDGEVRALREALGMGSTDA